MILYANGDSHTAPLWSYAGIVGEKLGLSVVNQAIGGSSNASILRRTRDYLEVSKPDFIIIGWSTWEREEWQHNDQFFNVNSSGHDVLPIELQDRYKHWVAEQTSDMLSIKSQQWHEDIYNFHLELEQKNIKHLFFNCMYDFVRKSNSYNWNNRYIDPYNKDKSYYWYLKNNGFKSDEWYHYKEDGHVEWAQLLINHIKENKLL